MSLRSLLLLGRLGGFALEESHSDTTGYIRLARGASRYSGSNGFFGVLCNSFVAVVPSGTSTTSVSATGTLTASRTQSGTTTSSASSSRTTTSTVSTSATRTTTPSASLASATRTSSRSASMTVSATSPVRMDSRGQTALLCCFRDPRPHVYPSPTVTINGDSTLYPLFSAQGNPCSAKPTLCLPLANVTSANLTKSLSWFVFFPAPSPLSTFPAGFVGRTSAAVASPPVLPGYQLTASIIHFGSFEACSIGDTWPKYFGYYSTSTTTDLLNAPPPNSWHSPGSFAVTLPYGSSTKLAYFYEPRNEGFDRGCAWCVILRRQMFAAKR